MSEGRRKDGAEQGLTLVELALGLLVLGALLTLVAPALKQSVGGRKTAAGKETVAAARDQVIGWAMLQPSGAKRLPGAGALVLPQDPWARPLIYIPDDASIAGAQDLTTGDLCAASVAATDLQLTLPGPTLITNVAFVIASHGARRNNSSGQDYTYTTNPIDLRASSADDIVDYVTLDQLKAYVCGR